MKRNVLVFGLILGVLSCINVVMMVDMVYNRPNAKPNDVIGYAAMVIVFSLTFFGIRNYRNKQLNGIISFGKAFKTGALIALLGSTVYVIFWMFYHYLVVPDFIDKYISFALNNCQRSGFNAEQMAEKTKELENMREMYKSPVFVALITYSEVLPIGLIVALISALILKRKKPLNDVVA
ncbi:MAG: DUF4199 domain-containing protein [Chitinophagaceae bacterium]|nr:MAG: DUF4199 domain-containing protein [Chitinophagaceae bacterium]